MHRYACLQLAQIEGPAIQLPGRTLDAAAVHGLRALRDGLGRAIVRWQEHLRERQARTACLALSDHMLRDIGISRDEIADPILWEPSAWRAGW